MGGVASAGATYRIFADAAAICFRVRVSIFSRNENDTRIRAARGYGHSLDGDAIARAKLRVEVRLKHLKAYKPSIWGEQSTLNVKQSDPQDVDQMTTEELAAKIAELEHKDRVVNEDRRVA